MNTKRITITAAVLIFLLALGMTLYPLISNQYNERHQSIIHTAYQEQIEQLEDKDILEAKRMAMAYNESIKPGVQETDSYSKEALQFAAQDYKTQLDITGRGIMGYVKIPKISVTLPIYHGTDANTLETGIGHLLGSSLPIGGESTHTILTAHSGMAAQKMFSDLDLLKEGDVFYLEVLDETHLASGAAHLTQTSLPIGGDNTNCVIAGHRGWNGAAYFRYVPDLQIGDIVTVRNIWDTLTYVVVETKIIAPNDVNAIRIQEGRELLTLLTCHPYASGGKQRFLVICERVN